MMQDGMQFNLPGSASASWREDHFSIPDADANPRTTGLALNVEGNFRFWHNIPKNVTWHEMCVYTDEGVTWSIVGWVVPWAMGEIGSPLKLVGE